jgi:hypothetical protein
MGEETRVTDVVGKGLRKLGLPMKFYDHGRRRRNKPSGNLISTLVNR